MIMRRLLTIILTLLLVLPHPALLAGVKAQTCGAAEQCTPDCPCCAAGHCDCAAQRNKVPSPPLVPLTGAELHPVPALPSEESDAPVTCAAVAAVRSRVPAGETNLRMGRVVPLFVRHCAWLR